MDYLGLGVDFKDLNADFLEVILLGAEQSEPGRLSRQDDAQFPGAQVNAGASDRLGAVAHENVRPQRVVHVVPATRQKDISPRFGGQGRTPNEENNDN